MSKKILIIEDERILREMYYDKFAQADLETIIADSAEEGMEILSKIKPDLILLDILLPQADGISFLTSLRKNKKLSSLKVIAFSNFDSPETRKAAFELGVKDYLIKTNYTPQEIVDKIKIHLK